MPQWGIVPVQKLHVQPSTLSHLEEVVGEYAFNDKEGEEEWPFTLNVVKHLELCRVVVESVGILQGWRYIPMHVCVHLMNSL